MCFNSYLRLERRSLSLPNDGNEPGKFAELAIIQVEREGVFILGQCKITSLKRKKNGIDKKFVLLLQWQTLILPMRLLFYASFINKSELRFEALDCFRNQPKSSFSEQLHSKINLWINAVIEIN